MGDVYHTALYGGDSWYSSTLLVLLDESHWRRWIQGFATPSLRWIRPSFQPCSYRGNQTRGSGIPRNAIQFLYELSRRVGGSKLGLGHGLRP